jgi:hypothetical protein
MKQISLLAGCVLIAVGIYSIAVAVPHTPQQQRDHYWLQGRQ